jgi:hypothetical protein
MKTTCRFSFQDYLLVLLHVLISVTGGKPRSHIQSEEVIVITWSPSNHPTPIYAFMDNLEREGGLGTATKATRYKIICGADQVAAQLIFTYYLHVLYN